MSEQGLSSVVAAGERDQAAVQPGAGAMLRAAREAQGLHIAMLAVTLKVPVKKLEALELDRYDLLPDTVFARALASSVCRALKIDPVPVLAALPQAHLRKIRTDESGLNATFNDSVSGAGITTFFQMKKPLGIAVLTLLVGIIAIVFWPSKPLNHADSLPPADDTSVLAPVAAEMPTQPAASAPASMLPDSMNDRIQAEAASPSQVAGSSPAVSLELTPTAAIPSNSDAVLTLHAHGESWVEVLDAQGAPKLRRTVMKDEIVPVSGVLPLTVVLGRADAVAVAIRGQAFDIAPLTKNNVARFEVK